VQPEPKPETDVILEARDLTKSFAGFVAVDGVALKIRRGTIHALIGPNGAGKTTCFNLLTKFLQPTSGSIYYKGVNVTQQGSADLARRGLVRSFQISSVFPHLTAFENVRIAAQRKRGNSFDFWRPMSELEELDSQCQSLLEVVGLSNVEDTAAAELPYGHKRALEIATTLALDPDVLLLDEPTAGMGHEDVGRVIDLIRNVSRSRTVLLVEHNLSVVSSLANTISVMVRGKVVAEGDYATIANDRTVIESYLGSDDDF
jgi:branched-chain amino acid transport system ATP-binding protein